MGKHEKGSDWTQQLKYPIIAVAILMVSGLAGVFVAADDASAADTSYAGIELNKYYVGPSAEVDATFTFNETDSSVFSGVAYEATLKNSSGASSGTIADKAGEADDAVSSWNTKITAPTTVGTYTLTVTFTETYQDNSTNKITSQVNLYVCEPITLSITVKNNGGAMTNADVYFVIDGQTINESKSVLNVASGKTQTVTYKYYDHDLASGKHTYKLVAADNGYAIEGLDQEYSFYYNQGSMDYANYIVAIFLVIIIAALVWVYRKPVKNYGKPKSRR